MTQLVDQDKAERLAAQKEKCNKAYQSFCYAGASHLGIFQRPLTLKQKKIFNLARVGWSADQISKRVNLSAASVYDALQKIRHNGWSF